MALLTNGYQNSTLALEQIRQQTNGGPQLFNARNPISHTAPRGTKLGDMAASHHPRGALLTVYGDRGTATRVVIPRNSVENLGTQLGTGTPVIENFPEDGNYGWWIDEGAGTAYWTINIEGTLYWTTAANGGINFTQISGTITNDQHGALGRQTGGGNPHHTNATTAQPGFLSTTFFDLLDTATAAATALALVKRNASGESNFAGTSGFVNITASGDIQGQNLNITNDAGISGTGSATVFDAQNYFSVAGTQVVGTQNTGWTVQTATPSQGDLGATPTVGDIASWASAIQAMLKLHGLID